jgi:exopolyphosphatase/guanosine-5'-triphosphate,3'-diphosphate pyrophosphatase
VARYHRGSLPKKRHPSYGALSQKDRKTVSQLAAILRVADGLDRSHRCVVSQLTAEILPRRVRIACEVRSSAEEERQAALEKGDLFTEVFERELSVACSRR